MSSGLPDTAVFDIRGVDMWLVIRFIDLELLSKRIGNGDVGGLTRLDFIDGGLESLCMPVEDVLGYISGPWSWRRGLTLRMYFSL